MGTKQHIIVRNEEDISPLDRKIINNMCHKCPFYAINQEYWEREYECGAYKLVRQLLIENLIDFDQISEILFNQLNKKDRV